MAIMQGIAPDNSTKAIQVDASGHLRINPGTLTNGAKAVAAAGTAEALAADTDLTSGYINIKALSTNTGLVYVGDSDVDSTNGYPLAAGESVALTVANLNQVYVDAAVNGEAVRFIAC